MNTHHIRLAALDMDGTLLRDDKTLSPYTLQVLHSLAKRGIMLVPATGRPRTGLMETILTVSSVSYAICTNGACIEDLKHNEVLASWPLRREHAVLVAEYLQHFPVYFYMHTKQGTFCQNALDLDWLKQHFPFLTFPNAPVCNLADLLRRREIRPLKIGILAPDPEVFQQLMSNPLPVPGIRKMQTGPENIEINSEDASKGAALKWLCRYLHISPEQTLAIGDSQNDLEMLSTAGVSAAMENGLEEVKQAAHFICRSNQEDGAARFLAEYFGLDELI